MHNPKLKHRLHRVTLPALFLRGESDGLVSADYLEAYAALLPNARTLTIAGAGHVPQLEQPDRPFVSWRATNSWRADMRAWHFSENAYPYLPPARTIRRSASSLPNRIYDR